jgi:hypothetical protein
LGADALIAASRLLGDEGQTLESTVAGASMDGTLPPGTRIRVRCGAPSPLEPGTVVVVAVHGGTLFVHRVIAVGKGRRAADFVITRGDGSLLCDGPTHRGWLVGVVTEYHDGGTWRLVPAHRGRSAMARLAAGAHELAMLAALHLDVALARSLARLSLNMAGSAAALRRRLGWRPGRSQTTPESRI